MPAASILAMTVSEESEVPFPMLAADTCSNHTAGTALDVARAIPGGIGR